jgi:hypothetical protein
LAEGGCVKRYVALCDRFSPSGSNGERHAPDFARSVGGAPNLAASLSGAFAASEIRLTHCLLVGF